MSQEQAMGRGMVELFHILRDEVFIPARDMGRELVQRTAELSEPLEPRRPVMAENVISMTDWQKRRELS